MFNLKRSTRIESYRISSLRSQHIGPCRESHDSGSPFHLKNVCLLLVQACGSSCRSVGFARLSSQGCIMTCGSNVCTFEGCAWLKTLHSHFVPFLWIRLLRVDRRRWVVFCNYRLPSLASSHFWQRYLMVGYWSFSSLPPRWRRLGMNWHRNGESGLPEL